MHILFLTHRLPYAPNRGDRVRAYHLLKLLRPIADVTLVSLVHDDDEASRVGDLKELASEVHIARVPRLANFVRGAASLPTGRPLTHALLASPGMGDIVRQRVAARPPDVVLAYCSGVAQYAVRPPLSSFPLVVDMLDVDSVKWSALSATARVPRTWIYAREARTLAAFERALAANALATVVVTEREREALAAIAPDARLEVIPNGVDYAHLAPSAPAGSSNDVVFCGVMNYSPNADGAVWMANEVWPAVRAEVPEARLKIVGSSPSSAVLGLRSIPGVDVTGAVPDVRPYLWNGAVGIAPLQVARGVQNKVLEAVAAGLPVVITPPVAAGLPAAVTAACRTATAARDFADHVVAFLRMPPEARRAIASSVDLAPLAWEARLRPFVALLEEAATSRRRPR